jgi:hypothetical protein
VLHEDVELDVAHAVPSAAFRTSCTLSSIGASDHAVVVAVGEHRVKPVTVRVRMTCQMQVQR